MKIIFALLVIVLVNPIWAAYFTDLETVVKQPDGTVLHLFASGDEYYNWLHDKAGYTIIQSDIDGYYYYAQPEGEILVASSYKVNSIDPATTGLSPQLKFSESHIRKKIDAMAIPTRRDLRPLSRNNLNNLAVYIRFSDQEEFSEPRSFFEQKFNDNSPDSVSLRNYYKEVSYDQLELITYHYPECPPEISLSYQDEHPRAYFLPYNAETNPEGYQYWERTEREHQLLADAIDFISSEVPEDVDIDYNDDGYVDNVCFVIRGVHSAWADLLWAHRWALYSNNAFINGLQVWDYTFQPENQNTVRVLAHEMFHALGAPDLYHYNFDGISPAGPWDIMESGFVHMGAHMKYKYGGWIPTVPEITESGLYYLNPLGIEENNCYKIASPNSPNEYFVVEFRKRDPDTFDRNVPGSGLLIYRIIEGINGNANGPPDEVYIYRENGTLDQNGSIVRAHFTEDEYRVAFNDFTDPSCFLSTGNSGGINLSNISSVGEQISFQVNLDPTFIPPLVDIIAPAEDAILPIEDIQVVITAEDQYNELDYLHLYLDDSFLTTFTAPPFEYILPIGPEDIGLHQITVEAYNDIGLGAWDNSSVRIIDPAQQNWFNWYTEEPDYRSWGRGCIPIQVAVDFNLGETEYYIKQVSLNIEPDPYGSAPEPGLVNCQIVELDDQGITENVLYDVGSFITPMQGRYNHDVYSEETITGNIAVIMDISSYQNILFDQLGTTGHSWITETDRPWVDALSRGVLGAADIGILLSTDATFTEDNIIPGRQVQLVNYPNPFNPYTTISFSLTASVHRSSSTAEGGEDANLIIYNIKGQKVRTFTFLNGILETSGVPSHKQNDQPTNRYEVTWDGRDETGKAVPSGIYLYELITTTAKYSRKMLLLK